jgi:hypothetical protein
MLSTGGFYLRTGMRERREREIAVRTFSSSFGMSSARRSLRETGFVAVDERRAAGKAARKREGRDYERMRMK